MVQLNPLYGTTLEQCVYKQAQLSQGRLIIQFRRARHDNLH